MIKLYTLKNLSDFSSDAVFKICLALEKYGLKQSQIKEFDSYDELYFETIVALEQGEHIIVAAENSDYNEFKRNIISRFILEECSSEEIQQVIEKNAGDDIDEIDITGHSLVARDSVVHFSRDGLYCGFTSDALLGRVTCVPLDFMRIDRIINLFKEDVLPEISGQDNKGRAIIMPEVDLYPAISGYVSTLRGSSSTMALATGEATMWIYSYYDKVEGFNDTLKFVEVQDSKQEDNATADSESVRIIRHAKEAMTNAGTDFGAAISEVYSTVNEKGQTVYFAYAALVDKGSAKAKKINTSNPDDLAVILPHAVGVLGTLVNDRIAAIKAQKSQKSLFDDVDEPDTDEKPAGLFANVSKKMLVFGGVVIAAAIIIPVILVLLFFGGGGDTNQPVVLPPEYSDTTATTEPSTTETSQVVVTPNLTEPSTQNITMPSTQPAVSSQSGTFTFDVFGYGHGVGLSQHGANYLAQQGWTWSEILAHYYYCDTAKILTGDVCPNTVSYNGTDYTTREFLASVLEAEMGSSFHPEALRAQYVAIYTYAKYKRFTLDTGDCAILGSGKTPSNTIYAVVDEMMEISPYIVDGNGACALTPFHSISAGKTTSFYNAWQQRNVEYLSGARISYGDTLLGDAYRSSYSISTDEFKRLVEGKTLPDGSKITLSGDPSTWISVISHDGALGDQVGYVSSMRVGGGVVSGNYFRITIMEGRIRSHCFYVTYTPDNQQ
ncbi:MAG: hypothetical protein IKY78_01070 [Clostridia bacterium]|nr:hypothetical protein [Clostridia bacterium]